MNNITKIFFLASCIGILCAPQSYACTGITLTAADGSVVVARTMDWSSQELHSMYVVAPREYTTQSLVPGDTRDGIIFSNIYGYVGLALEQPEFIVDGTNEAGLSAALFNFPVYGKYSEYNPAEKEKTLSDAQVVAWILSQFSSIDQVKHAIKNVNIVGIDPRVDALHWRITEPSGRQVIMEITDGVAHFYDSELGVLTNAPNYPWHIKNLNNYVNLIPGTAGPIKMGPLTLRAFGAGSGFLGLPGDFTPPSRFVRAAFLQTYSITQPNAHSTAMQAFHILNNFDVPLGVQFPVGGAPDNMPAATQWTIATDLSNKIIYYHTMYDRTIREINMGDIDFSNVSFQYKSLDEPKSETIIPVQIIK